MHGHCLVRLSFNTAGTTGTEGWVQRPRTAVKHARQVTSGRFAPARSAHSSYFITISRDHTACVYGRRLAEA